jgi:hypothetical protein
MTMTPKIALALTWFSFIVAGMIGYASAQLSTPSLVTGCVVVGAAPTYTAAQVVALTCNTAGQLRMSTTP